MKEFDKERERFAKAHSIAEKQALPYFRKALAANIAPVLKWVEDFGTDNVPVEKLIKEDVWMLTYPQVYQIIGMKFAKNEYYWQRNNEGVKASAIEFLVDIWSGTLKDYALKYTYQIQRQLNDTTIDIITRALGDEAFLGLDRLGRVRLFFKNVKDAMKSRSLSISRTEATTISNLGKEIGARSWIDQNGGQGYKVWLGRNDERERNTHLAENNTILPIDDLYDLGGDLCNRPGDINLKPANRINCRCTQSVMSQNRYNRLISLGRIVNGKLIGAS